MMFAFLLFCLLIIFCSQLHVSNLQTFLYFLKKGQSGDVDTQMSRHTGRKSQKQTVKWEDAQTGQTGRQIERNQAAQVGF